MQAQAVSKWSAVSEYILNPQLVSLGFGSIWSISCIIFCSRRLSIGQFGCFLWMDVSLETSRELKKRILKRSQKIQPNRGLLHVGSKMNYLRHYH